MTDDEVLKKHDSREMLKRPHLWPHKLGGEPMVALKRRDEPKAWPREFARLVKLPNEYRLFLFGEGSSVSDVQSPATTDELIDAGWEVD